MSWKKDISAEGQQIIDFKYQTTMYPVEGLREFVNERLTAAAEEIFGVFKRMIVEYEEEIDRQRKLLSIVWKPEGNVNSTELPQEPVCKEEEEVLHDQERNQEEPQPVEIKEEEVEEELCSGQEGELLVLKLEADDAFTPDGESEPELQADHQSQQHNDPDSGSTTDSDTEHKRHRNPLTGQTFFRCDICGKDFKYQTTLQIHLRKHTGEEPNVCKLCGKDFQFGSRLRVHMRSHTGEKPYCCQSCGKSFGYRSGLIKHARVHTGEEALQ